MTFQSIEELEILTLPEMAMVQGGLDPEPPLPDDIPPPTMLASNNQGGG